MATSAITPPAGFVIEKPMPGVTPPAGFVLEQPNTPPGIRQPVSPELQSSLPGGDIPVVGAMTQPFGEILAGLKYDKKFRNETSAYGAGSALAVGGAAAAPEAIALTPAALEAVQAAAKAHPLLAKIITKGLEGAGFSAGLGGLAKLQKLLSPSSAEK